MASTVACQQQASAHHLLNPQRQRDPSSGCLLPKVFIAYPHNPSPYTQLPTDVDSYRHLYPDESDDVIQQRIAQSVHAHNLQQEANIKQHMAKIYGLATFLQQARVTVAYDQPILDVGHDNFMRWCQEQMEDADFVILIITESFKEFINGEVPPESEKIFVGNFLSNFIHNPPQGKLLLPVFLDQAVNCQLLPKCLEMNTMYSVYTPPMLGRGDNLEALYALLTKQDRYTPPSAATGPIKLNRRRPRIGAGVTTDSVQRDSAGVVSSSHHRRLFESLLQLYQPPSDIIIASVSDNRLFSVHWRELARHLGLSDAEIERCQERGIRDEAENCLQMLKMWRNTRVGVATVAILADAVYNKCKNSNMLEILHGACLS